jgi:hypothetical protein
MGYVSSSNPRIPRIDHQTGTCLLVFVFGAAANGLTLLDVSPIATSLYAALVNWVGLSLFILTAAPATGGHLK